MTERPAMLRWEISGGWLHAYSGRVLVVVAGPRGTVIWHALSGSKFYNQQYVNQSAARRGITRRWATWLRYAELAVAPKTMRRPAETV